MDYEFATNLFMKIIQKSSSNTNGEEEQQNCIVSPFSIQTCLAMSFFGASGATAEEMITGLRLSTKNQNEISEKYEKLINATKLSTMVRIANKIYVKKGFTIKRDFLNTIQKSFNSEIDELDFTDTRKSVNLINQWVENLTNHKIQNLVAENLITQDTRMMLINAIYFRGKWAYPFNKYTYKSKFWTQNNVSVTVDMMQNSDDWFKYGEFNDLDATAVELPYDNSDISMMIILPNKRDGLQELEVKLKTMNIFDMSQKMVMTAVGIQLPKFKISYSINLNQVLATMGMKKMFSDLAEFPNILNEKSNLKISSVLHKAFIEVDETGTEAAAATDEIVAEALSGRLLFKFFTVNHPFVFLIKDSNAIYFMGHIVKF